MTPISPTTISEPDVRADGGRPAFTLTELLVVIVLILLLLGITVVALNRILDSMARSGTVNALNQLQTVAAEFETQTNGQAVNHLVSVTTPVNWNTTQFNTDESPSGKYDPNAAGALPCYAGLQGKYVSPDPGNPPTAAAFRGYLNDLAGDLKDTSVKRFIAGVWSTPSCKDMISKMDRKYARSSDGMGSALSSASAPPNDKCQPIGTAMLVDGLLEVRDGWDTKIVYAAYVKYPEPGGDLDTSDDFLPRRTTPFFVSAGPDRDFGSMGPTATPAQQHAALDNIYSNEAD